MAGSLEGVRKQFVRVCLKCSMARYGTIVIAGGFTDQTEEWSADI